MKLLVTAKLKELLSTGVQSPSELASEEMARHCRRRTQVAEKTIELIDVLLFSHSGATDSLEVPLFKEQMKDVWEEQ